MIRNLEKTPKSRKVILIYYPLVKNDTERQTFNALISVKKINEVQQLEMCNVKRYGAQ